MRELSQDREDYAAAADRMRDELMRTLGELERRKELWIGYKNQLIHSRGLWIAVGVLGGIVTAAVIATSVLTKRRHQRNRWTYRRDALARAWQHPRRVATRREDRPALANLGMKVAMAFALAMAKRLATRSAELAVSELPGRDELRPSSPPPPAR